MKTFLFLTALFVAVPLASAQLVVTNPISDVLSEEQHLEDLAKWIESINHQVQQIQTLTQQLQQTQAYVKAFGDPAKLRSIVGADALMSSLQQSGVGQTLAALQQTANGALALKNDANGIYQSLNTTFTTPLGNQVQRAEQSYRKFGAIQQAAHNLQAVTDDVTAKRAALRQQIARTTQQLQASTTDAETQKLNGVLAGYTAELGTIDHETDEAAAQVGVQDAENRADTERQAEARREERRAQMEEGFRHFGEVFQIDPSTPAFPTSR